MIVEVSWFEPADLRDDPEYREGTSIVGPNDPLFGISIEVDWPCVPREGDHLNWRTDKRSYFGKVDYVSWSTYEESVFIACVVEESEPLSSGDVPGGTVAA